MPDEYEILEVEKPEWAVIGGGVSAYNQEQAGPEKGTQLCFVLRGPDGEVAGGVIAATHYGWLYIDLMWVKEERRGQGHGSRLLARLEAKARALGAKNAYLDTFSFQAPRFYKKFGYRVFGELPDFPAGHTRYYLTKTL